MNVSLTPVLENYVKEKVETGLYDNASEVMRDALRLLREKEMKTKQLFDALDKGYQSYKEGKYTEYKPDLVDEIMAKVTARHKV